MFIRGRERIAEVWPRFKVPMEGFIVTEQRGMFEARVVANADRALDVFLDLARHLAPTINVYLGDYRDNREWHGEGIPLADARAAIRGVRTTLAAQAGVECALFDEADQVTLSPHLEVFVYGLTERWYYFLRDLGLPRYRSLWVKSWRPELEEFPPAASIEPAIAEVVSQLGLRER